MEVLPMVLTEMNELALRLYRSYAFGEDLDDEWSRQVVEAASVRRVSLERLIDELVTDAVTMLTFAERGSAVRDNGRKAA